MQQHRIWCYHGKNRNCRAQVSDRFKQISWADISIALQHTERSFIVDDGGIDTYTYIHTERERVKMRKRERGNREWKERDRKNVREIKTNLCILKYTQNFFSEFHEWEVIIINIIYIRTKFYLLSFNNVMIRLLGRWGLFSCLSIWFTFRYFLTLSFIYLFRTNTNHSIYQIRNLLKRSAFSKCPPNVSKKYIHGRHVMYKRWLKYCSYRMWQDSRLKFLLEMGLTANMF